MNCQKIDVPGNSNNAKISMDRTIVDILLKTTLGFFFTKIMILFLSQHLVTIQQRATSTPQITINGTHNLAI
jgi:hypothetical protein